MVLDVLVMLEPDGYAIRHKAYLITKPPISEKSNDLMHGQEGGVISGSDGSHLISIASWCSSKRLAKFSSDIFKVNTQSS